MQNNNDIQRVEDMSFNPETKNQTEFVNSHASEILRFTDHILRIINEPEAGFRINFSENPKVSENEAILSLYCNNDDLGVFNDVIRMRLYMHNGKLSVSVGNNSLVVMDIGADVSDKECAYTLDSIMSWSPAFIDEQHNYILQDISDNNEKKKEEERYVYLVNFIKKVQNKINAVINAPQNMQSNIKNTDTLKKQPSKGK